MQFGSDNQTGCSQKVLDAITCANAGHTHGYGDDDWTRQAIEKFREVFETDLDVYFVSTGTAANCLALASMVQPWQVILCHAQAHIVVDESTAPEFFTGGARTQGIGHGEGKITVHTLKDHLARMGKDMPHNSQAGALSIAQITECGLVYTPQEIEYLAECVHANSMTLHMDGARFSNALVAQDCSPADLTWRAGVDILSLGASKNGCLAAEAILVFNKSLVPGIEFRRKRSGHLVSKGRFFGAQFLAWLQDGHWLDLARHANSQAAEVAKWLIAVPGVSLVWPVDANELFVVMPHRICKHLQECGAEFYEWSKDTLPTGWGEHADEVFVRLVCSFATTDVHVSLLTKRLQEISGIDSLGKSQTDCTGQEAVCHAVLS